MWTQSGRLPARSTIREVVLHPGGVTAIPVLKDGRLLLIRQFRYPIGKFILELPAGKLDSGQTPLDTIAREIEEETGYCAGTLTQECTFYTTPGFSNESIHLFLARDLTLKAQRLEEGEHITVVPYSLEECLEKIQNRGDQRRQNHPRHSLVSPKISNLNAFVTVPHLRISGSEIRASGRSLSTGEAVNGRGNPMDTDAV